MKLYEGSCPRFEDAKLCEAVLSQRSGCLSASRSPLRVLGKIVPPFVVRSGFGNGLSAQLWRTIAQSLGLSFNLTLMESSPDEAGEFRNGSFDVFLPDVNIQWAASRQFFDGAKASPVTNADKIMPVVGKRLSQSIDKDSILAHLEVRLWLALALFYPLAKMWGPVASKFSLTAWWLIVGMALNLLANSLAISLYAPPAQAAFISSVGQLHRVLADHECQLSDTLGSDRADALRDAVADALNMERDKVRASYRPIKVYQKRKEHLVAIARGEPCLIGAEYSSVLELLRRMSCGVEAVDLAGLPSLFYAHPYKADGPHTATLDAFFARPGFTEFYARFIVRTLDEFSVPRLECPSLEGQDRPLRMGKLRGAFQASVAAAALALLALASELAKYHLSPKAILYSHSFTKA